MLYFGKTWVIPVFFDRDFDISDSDTAMAEKSSSMSKSAELIPVSPKSFLTFFLV